MVDYVNDAVGRRDVGGNNVGVVDLDAGRGVNADLRTLRRFDGQGLALDVARHHFTRNYMIGQDGDELILVLRLEEILNGDLSELVEALRLAEQTEQLEAIGEIA